MRKRLALLASLWTVTFGWHLRFYETWAGSPIPPTFGVNIDWTRNQIVQSGHIGNFEPWTLVSSYMGAQNYDFASVLLAVLNIITNTTGLSEALTLLNAIQLAGLGLIPVSLLYWYKVTNGVDISSRGAYLILLVSLFPSHQTIGQVAEGWYNVPIAIGVALFILTFLARAATSRRVFAILVALIFFMTNLYQTWVFIFLSLLGTIYLFDVFIVKIVFRARTETLAVPTALFLIAGGVFFISGVYLNRNFTQLFRTSGLVILSSITESRVATGTALIQSSPTSLFEPNPRRAFKFLNALAAVCVVCLYAVTRTRAVLRQPDSVLDDPYERVVLGGLCAFPFLIFVFFSYRGIGAAIGRTRYVGIFFVILAAALLFRTEHPRLRQSVTILLAVMVVTAVPGFFLTTELEPNHTLEEEQSIEWTGMFVPQDSYVFSDASMGAPLGYYDFRGISIVMTQHRNWNERMRAIYYRSDAREGLRAIHATIADSRISNDAPPVQEYYILQRSVVQDDGVPLLAQRTKPTGIDPREKFKRTPSLAQVHTTGSTTLFYRTSAPSGDYQVTNEDRTD